MSTIGQIERMTKNRVAMLIMDKKLLDTDAELAALERRRAKTRAPKQGMVQELLTGRTWLI